MLFKDTSDLRWVQKELTPSDVHTDRMLTDFSVGWFQPDSGFIHQIIFPNRSTDKRSDYYRVHDVDSVNRGEMPVRAPATESHGTGYSTSQGTFFCHVYGLHIDIDEQTQGNADSVFSLGSEATDFLMKTAMIARERQWAATFYTTGIWGADYTGVASGPTGTQFLQWDDVAATPVDDVKGWMTAMQLLSGLRPNLMVIPRLVWDALTENTEIVDRIKYGQTPNQAAVVTTGDVARLFGIERIIIAEAIYNTAAEGAAASNAFIFGKRIGLFHVPASSGVLSATPGLSFGWRGYGGANAFGQRMKTIPMPTLEAVRYELGMAYDMKLTAPRLGAIADAVIG